jgi:hypothetical protein
MPKSANTNLKHFETAPTKSLPWTTYNVTASGAGSTTSRQHKHHADLQAQVTGVDKAFGKKSGKSQL